MYSPNVEYLNICLARWAEQGNEFYGIVHSHYQDDRRLSSGDLKYITRIFDALPMCIDKLYFPLIFPSTKQMVSFLASRTENGIRVVDDEVSTR